jgi:hypothetical protein
MNDLPNTWPKLEVCDRYITDGESYGCEDCGHSVGAHIARQERVKLDRMLYILEEMYAAHLRDET